MKSKVSLGIALAAICIGGLTLYLRSTLTGLSGNNAPGFAEIKKGDYAAGESDELILSNGERIQKFGYMTFAIGELARLGKAPLYLFRTLSCWDCPQEILLRAVDSETGEITDLPHPQRRTIGGPEVEEEHVSLLVRGIYGDCINRRPSVLVTSQSRQIDSDGEELKVPEDWEVETHRLTIREDGTVAHEKTPESGVSELNSLVSESCLEIPPEELTEDM